MEYTVGVKLRNETSIQAKDLRVHREGELSFKTYEGMGMY